MGIDLILLLVGVIGAVVSSVAGIATTGIQAGINNKSTRDTNETNLQIARETNASNVQQAELAYQRSLPTAQIKQLIDAGMSKPAALSALTGGGTYNAPVLQSANMQAPHTDLSGISSAFERLTNIPSNVMQAGLIQDQRDALQKDIEIKLNQDRRAQEEHEFNIWRQQYDKNTATMLDTASSKVANTLIDSGKTIEDFKDFETMIRDLGLSDDRDIRNLTYVARQQLQEGVQSKFDSERARQQQENQNQASKDAHDIAVKHQKQLDQQIQDFEDAKDARTKEYKAREFKAILEQMASEQGIAFKQLENTIKFYRDDNGVLHAHPVEGIASDVKEFWDVLFTFVPVKPLAEILAQIFK